MSTINRHLTVSRTDKTVPMPGVRSKPGEDCSLDDVINNGIGSQFRMKMGGCWNLFTPNTVTGVNAITYGVHIVSPFTVPLCTYLFHMLCREI